MQTAEHIRLCRSSPLRPALMAVFLLILLGVVWLDARYLQAYRIVWRRELVSYPRSLSGVFYHGGRLYVPDSAGNLFALDAKDGRTLWTFRIGDDWASISPEFVVDGVYTPLTLSRAQSGGRSNLLRGREAGTGW